ncbi:hypothetical protein QNS37_004533 [Vibrio parahaemolyticus]|nr:hypothetical protein [Vibrio parahaemolyticus]EJG1679219.1 hypothetical protein [Vibrio parahaemolyticus]EJG1721901.1 hypothetical protein [Vibrio parahaemolyticus]EJG1763480.1 hypothetical protein [Vibrio parahaemolyticus]ELB2017093.1 hypothetical protein [Vibrio parahaemolyticus]
MLKYVTDSDKGKVEGKREDIMPLFDAIEKVCDSEEANLLWELILKKYELGPTDTSSWVVNMNAAIKLWNDNEPSCAESIRKVFGL